MLISPKRLTLLATNFPGDCSHMILQNFSWKGARGQVHMTQNLGAFTVNCPSHNNALKLKLLFCEKNHLRVCYYMSQSLVCGTVFRHTSLLPPLSLSIFCCRLKSHLSSISYYMSQSLVCGTVFHHTSLLPPSLSPSSAVVLNHISSQFLILLSDSSLICTVPAQWLVILDTIIVIRFNVLFVYVCPFIWTAASMESVVVVLVGTVYKHGNHGNRDFCQMPWMPWFCQNAVFCHVLCQNAIVLRFHKNILFLIGIIWSLLCEFHRKIFTFSATKVRVAEYVTVTLS